VLLRWLPATGPGIEYRVRNMPPSKARPVRSVASAAESPSQLIDLRIAELGDWRGEMLSRVRALIKEADPEVTEEWKWSTPVWSHDGIICTGESYQKAVKLTFAKGAALPDPSGLFNASLQGNVRRAIDFREGDKLDEPALRALIQAAVALNAKSSARGTTAPPPVPIAPVREKIPEPPGNLAARARAFAKRSGGGSH
jgi:hypothetical protein